MKSPYTVSQWQSRRELDESSPVSSREFVARITPVADLGRPIGHGDVAGEAWNLKQEGKVYNKYIGVHGETEERECICI
jgi:hypothetical protein